MASNGNYGSLATFSRTSWEHHKPVPDFWLSSYSVHIPNEHGGRTSPATACKGDSSDSHGPCHYNAILPTTPLLILMTAVQF